MLSKSTSPEPQLDTRRAHDLPRHLCSPRAGRLPVQGVGADPVEVGCHGAFKQTPWREAERRRWQPTRRATPTTTPHSCHVGGLVEAEHGKESITSPNASKKCSPRALARYPSASQMAVGCKHSP